MLTNPSYADPSRPRPDVWSGLHEAEVTTRSAPCDETSSCAVQYLRSSGDGPHKLAATVTWKIHGKRNGRNEEHRCSLVRSDERGVVTGRGGAVGGRRRRTWAFHEDVEQVDRFTQGRP
ncbi:hypothetical protein FE633_28425 [Streptomyces montanus]|uniref:Uncharacterized protein n=1 Tax=Streptomyces montanus TaxID=2580423 RepID=A0A5R9FQT9_9ACTN|nr:hypothetical protein FE633_28425 [Streptomyces montanus]